MRLLHARTLLPVMLGCLLYSGGTLSEPANPKATLSLARAERLAVDLKQGMSAEEVEKLLGKPKRTALKGQGYSGVSDTQPGNLQWTYSWTSTSHSDRSLQIVFASKSPERWLVNSWDWSGY